MKRNLLLISLVFILFIAVSAEAECEKTVSCCLSEIPSPILAAQKSKIIYKPIQFGRTRVKLTREYACQHYSICKKSIVIVPQMIVLHWTDGSNWQGTYRDFYPSRLSKRTNVAGIPAYLKASSDLNLASQYLVDRDGTIYQLMPDNWMGRHVIGLNHVAIGIENVGGVGDRQDLTEAQVLADAYLVYRLKCKYPTIRYLIGHLEYLEFQNTPLWEEENPGYRVIKPDPGIEFMRKVREQVRSLGLLSRYPN